MPLKAWLDGEQPDLQQLAALFADGDVRVVRDDESGAYYLTAAGLDGAHEDDRVYATVETLIKWINGAARTVASDFKPVTYAGRYTTANGDQVIQPAGAHLTIRGGFPAGAVVRGSDGQLKPDPPSPAVARVALAASNSRVDKVLGFMASDLDWLNLYKVYELVRDDETKPASIAKMGWASENKQSAFRVSANDPEVSGDDARHAVSQGDPKRTMTLAEGQAFIIDLLEKWLKWLENPYPPPNA
ncbi:MAG: hypothetical protein ACLQLO_24910 [Mycobacterium sp.]